MKSNLPIILILVIPVVVFVGALLLANKPKTAVQEKDQLDLDMAQLPTQKKSYTAPPQMQLEQKDYKAVFKTSMGDITVDLFEKDSPNTVNNFVFLAKEGFYNDTIFHRVIEDFMIQGGDPLGNGTGGPGYSFDDEFNSIKLVKGSLAMANAGPNTNGSQFFIVTAESTPWLDGKHTNFGEVLAGQNIVDAMSAVEKNSMDKPVTDIKLLSVEIIAE